MAGVAGALYVPQVGIINPSEFAPANSIEAVIWVAVGGRGTLIGAVIGALVVNYAKTYFTRRAAPYWLFVLGGLFVVVTLFLPRGIVGTVQLRPLRERRDRDGWRRCRAPQSPQAGGVGHGRAPTTTALLYLDGVSVSFDGFARSTICRSWSSPARCAPSSARTAPARRR